MGNFDAFLVCYACNTSLKVCFPIVVHVLANHKDRSIGEEGMHFLQRNFASLRQERPEEYSVREIADDEDNVVLVAYIGDGHGRDLADHCARSEFVVRRMLHASEEHHKHGMADLLKGKACHRRNCNALRTSMRIENFSWNNPSCVTSV